MTYTRINTNTDGPIADDLPLSAAVGMRLEENTRHSITNRGQRAGVTYALGRSTSTGADPPDGDSTIVGPTAQIAGVNGSVTDAIGLRLASPPTMPIILDLGEFPLSAQATGLRVVVGCTVEVANVAVAAVATIGAVCRPQNPSADLVTDENGIVTFPSAMNAVTVGTSTPSGTQLCKPVVCTVDLNGSRGEMLARSDDGEGSGIFCRVYLAILSTRGTQGQNLGIDSQNDGGRVLVSSTAFNGLGVNPGPSYNWAELVNTNAADALSAAFLPRYRGVIQLRPSDITDVTSGAAVVIHPPIERTDAFGSGAAPEVNIWSCGVITVHGVTIGETTA